MFPAWQAHKAILRFTIPTTLENFNLNEVYEVGPIYDATGLGTASRLHLTQITWHIIKLILLIFQMRYYEP